MIQSLTLTGFRNLSFKTCTLSSGANFIYGENGAGKSAFIESLYFLSYGRSFRTSNPDNVIGFNSQYALIHADVSSSGANKSAAIMRETGKTTVKISGQKTTLSKVAKLSPALFVDSDTYREFMTSAVFRRRMFDWIGFHVKPGYLECARRYAALLRNRNAALKMLQDTSPWDQLLSDAAEQLSSLRHELYLEFMPFFKNECCEYLSGAELLYHSGYNQDAPFMSVLKKNIHVDTARKKTTQGPHAADWHLCIRGREARHVLSQGQQKTAYFNLIASLDDFLQSLDVTPLLLVDDYMAELDCKNTERFLSLIENRKGQSVISSIVAPEAELGIEAKLFHVKQLA